MPSIGPRRRLTIQPEPNRLASRSEKAPLARSAGAPAETRDGNIAELFLNAVDSFGKPDAVKYKGGNVWKSISHRRLYDDVKRLALGLEALGAMPGDRVAILSENRPEWLLCDLACVMSRTISVPLYPILPADQIEHMLRDSAAKIVFAETDEQLEKIFQLRPDLPSLERVISFVGPPADAADITRLSDVLELGESKEGDRPDEEYRADALATDPHDLLTIIYTSGTTGRPKGVMLTHNNLFSNVRGALEIFELGPDDVSLSVLPLCHVFERMAGHFVMIAAGVTICYAESLAKLGQNLLEVRPSVMTLVPRGYEKLVERVQEAARQKGPVSVRILRWATAIGGERLERRLQGRSVDPWLELRYRLADRLVFSKLRKRTGGRMRYFVSGGAPLSQEIASFLLSAGLTVLEGYGLTETSPAIAFNRPDAIKLGTVGKAIAGAEVRIAEDGEILTRGPHVMKGYYKNPEATAEAIDSDGWFHTGDIGEIDADGFLSITDRKKEIIVTAGGKNIAPQRIENRVVANPYVNQVVMLGDRRRFPILLISPNFAALEAWAVSRGIAFDGPEELVRDEQVNAFMENEILGSLRDLARFEQPKKITLISRELTVDSGELTPTLKVRRKVVEQNYGELIGSLYTED